MTSTTITRIGFRQHRVSDAQREGFSCPPRFRYASPGVTHNPAPPVLPPSPPTSKRIVQKFPIDRIRQVLPPPPQPSVGDASSSPTTGEAERNLGRGEEANHTAERRRRVVVTNPRWSRAEPGEGEEDQPHNRASETRRRH